MLRLMDRGGGRDSAWPLTHRAALRPEALSLAPTAAPIDDSVKAGEIVYLAGLEGQGQEAFERWRTTPARRGAG
jgi:ABC-type sugar transport system ATPase subunit